MSCHGTRPRATGLVIKNSSATHDHTQINKIRYVIGHVIGNFKTWRIMYTDYRRPIGAFPNRTRKDKFVDTGI